MIDPLRRFITLCGQRLALSLLFPATLAFAETSACEMPLIVVETENPDLRTRVCDVATGALPALKACHLEPVRPVVFSIGNEDLSNEGHSCLGLYHRETGEVSLLTPDVFAEQHAQSDFCDMIPAEVHFDSIVVHELTHALLDQSPCADSLCRIDNEYVAYAMQIDSLPQQIRARFLKRYGPRAPDQADRVNGFFLDVAPLAFAAASWLHFSDTDNGCDLVGRIISGDFTFRQDTW